MHKTSKLTDTGTAMPDSIVTFMHDTIDTNWACLYSNHTLTITVFMHYLSILKAFEAFYYGNKPNYCGFEVGMQTSVDHTRKHKEY